MATTIDPSPKSPTLGNSTKQLSADSKKSNFWREAAPKTAARADHWPAWSRYLSERRTPKPLTKLARSKKSPLGWGLASAEISSDLSALLSLVDRLGSKNKANGALVSKTAQSLLASWLGRVPKTQLSLDLALQCLAVTHTLPQVAEGIDEKLWWDVLDALWDITTSTSGWRVDSAMPAEQGLTHQLLTGELPLTLAYLLAEIRPLYKLREGARSALTEGIGELLNGNGLVQGPYLGSLRPLVACWTRCRIVGEQLKKGCWDRKADEEFCWLTTHAIGLSSPTGVPLLGSPHDTSWSPDFLANLLALGGDKADVEAAHTIYPKKLVSSLKRRKVNVVPDTSDDCEWAGVAYLRTEWDRRAALVGVDYSTPNLRIDLWNGTKQLLSGTWDWKTTLNGRPLEAVGSWDQTCWISDDEVDYLELSLELSNGAQLDRQILLARDDQILLLADYVLHTNGGALCHHFQLPMAEGASFAPAEETREAALEVAGRAVARALPLALPEWRVDPRLGQFFAEEGQLQLQHERETANLACPLLIDLNKSRASKPCTWRQLTVAETLEIQPPDVAVGYRAQCGKKQWLLYRSLAEAANRSVLGQNFSSEFFMGQFLAPSGEVDELLEIEG